MPRKRLVDCYADYAAATPIDSRVLKVMADTANEFPGNPSSLHRFGKQAARIIEQSRNTIATFINAEPTTIVFTSSGTESNNLALLGVAKANKWNGNHIIVSSIEHPSVLNACRALEKDSWKITYLPVTTGGIVKADQLKKAFKKGTVLVSIHLANSEIGVIQDISTLSVIAKKHGAYFHTDACQATSWLKLDVERLGVDLLTFNGSKVYGPRGIAVLYVRDGIQIFPILYGGGQENSLRSGTENLPAIAGLAEAVKIIAKQYQNDTKKVGQLRDKLQNRLETLPGVTINCAKSPRLPNHLSFVFNMTDETNLVKALDQQGIAVSSGSACSEKSIVESHILQAIGLTNEQIHRTIRISLGRFSTTQDIEMITAATNKLRRG